MVQSSENPVSGADPFELSLARVKPLVRGDVAGPQPAQLPGDLAVYVVIREKGRRLAEAWSPKGHSRDPLAAAISVARGKLSAKAHPDMVEVVFAHLFRPVKERDFKNVFNNLNRGLIGIQLTCGDKQTRYAPNRMIATNRSFGKIIETFSEEHARKGGKQVKPVVIRRFASEVFLVPLAEAQPPQRLFRGGRVVAQKDVTADAAAALARRMSDWMLNNLGDKGRMTYKYWPSRGEVSDANNMIRQWMATVALGRVARFYDDEAASARSMSNIRYNLNKFRASKGGMDFIYFEDESKLGATALAALALREHPDGSKLRGDESRLRSTVEHLWNADGSFTTFLIPEGENRNQNFYPGEALLYLARCYAETKDAALLEKIMTSVDYYRSWHLDNRNPAFVPWHVMAYETVWHETKNVGLRDWIFEMSDWLTGLQVPGSDIWPDTNGRFYDPERRHFGRPHASSTGVYLEGMIAAWRVARASDDKARQECYRVSLMRGLRNLMQLEFSDDTDMFYISRRGLVAGGVRTEVYDNEIRVDNVQHGLMAVLQVLRDFETEDFAAAVP